MIKSGALIETITAVAMCVLYIYYMNRAQKGQMPKIRDFPAIEAMQEGCERAAEEGKRVIIYPAHSRLNASTATMTYAYLDFARYTAEEAAKRGVPTRAPVADPTVLPLLESSMSEIYIRQGRPDLVSPDMVEYFAYGSAMAVCSMIYDDPGTSMMTCFGTGSSGTVTPLGVARQAGALTVGGCLRWTGMYQIALICDYILIGDETYAAADKLTGDPKGVAVEGGGDIIKLAILALLFISSILALIGNDAIVQWLKM